MTLLLNGQPVDVSYDPSEGPSIRFRGEIPACQDCGETLRQSELWARPDGSEYLLCPCGARIEVA